MGGMGRAADWLREERRKTLGDWVAFCLSCGHVQRYFEDGQVPPGCPACDGEVRHRCPGCGSRFSSAFAVECESCGAGLRPPELLGMPIRRDGGSGSRRSG